MQASYLTYYFITFYALITYLKLKDSLKCGVFVFTVQYVQQIHYIDSYGKITVLNKLFTKIIFTDVKWTH